LLRSRSTYAHVHILGCVAQFAQCIYTLCTTDALLKSRSTFAQICILGRVAQIASCIYTLEYTYIYSIYIWRDAQFVYILYLHLTRRVYIHRVYIHIYIEYIYIEYIYSIYIWRVAQFVQHVCSDMYTRTRCSDCAMYIYSTRVAQIAQHTHIWSDWGDRTWKNYDCQNFSKVSWEFP